ncbi:MAG: hypothetical protein FWE87_04915 [Coriobacteriia bacterium]|nr:hypothetical protein [Coriobacteriia bacterium]
MAFETKEQALAFVEAMRLTVKGKKGFTWLTGELDDLHSYIESIADENEQLRRQNSDSP